MWHRKLENVCLKLKEREYGGRGSVYRKNLRIMRSVVLQKDATFKRIFEKHSGYPITYERDKLYFNQHRLCLTTNGHGGKPQKLYELPRCPVSRKVQDAIVMGVASLDKLPLEHKGYQQSFLALKADNWLVRCDLDTGEELQAVYLSPFIKFKQIMEESECSRFIIKSVHQNSNRSGANSTNILMTIALFTIYPLEFIGMMEIDKQVFGKDLLDVMLFNGLLIAMHQRGFVRVHSWEHHILPQSKLYNIKLGENLPDHGIVGSTVSGLPINIKMKEYPPVLFEVKCGDHNLQMGGNPLHYVISPFGHEGIFKTYSLRDNHLAKNGVFESSIYSVEPEKVIFHPDDSGRLLHIIANEIKIYSINEQELHGLYIVKDCFSVHASGREPQAKKQDDGELLTTSSGRVVRKRSYDEDLVECGDDTIQGIDYENELDFLAVTAVNQSEDGYQGIVRFHDNYDGRILKEVVMEEPWKEFCDHIIGVDLDTIVHIVKGPMQKYSCYVYKLDRTCEETVKKHSPRETRTRRNRARLRR